jgi:diguanylate cyclase (GGDEF)-like protein/PAS domain S-box-containing protein
MEVWYRKFQGVPLSLWLVILASLVIPFLTDLLLRPETPLVIYLLFLFPVIIFAFYLSITKTLISTGIFSFLHTVLGVIYEIKFGQGIHDVDIRLYNHLGFTFISFVFVLLVGGLLKEMKESEYRYRSVVENSPQLILIHQNGQIIFANPTALELAGVSDPSDFVGKSIYDFVHPTSKDKLIYRGQKLLENERGNEFIEYKFIRPDGKCLHLELLGNLINYKGKEAILVVGKDVTSQKEYQEKIEFLAYHDSLTGLPNRYLLEKNLEEALQNSIETNRQLALMFIDLDRFKFINDTMGHKLGDSLLIQVSQRLIRSVREEDVVARQGGDEFLILLKNTGETEAEIIAKRIINSFTVPFQVEGEEFFSTSSIGISLFPKDGKDKDTLTRHADTAMYMAKKLGKNNFQFYSNENEEVRIRNNKLEQGLKRALLNEEFKLVYQPKVELRTGRISGIEALLRWNHLEFGAVSPADFIPLAEETGMIIPIGEWVLLEACKQLKMWHRAGLMVDVCVNVSTIQLEGSNFIEIIETILLRSELEANYLTLEITESVMQDLKNSAVIIQALKKLGVKVAIDDFGTGYSSLNVLNKLAVDYVKIDRSFINEMMKNSNTAALVKTMIEIGGNLHFELIAEGIEQVQQVEFLVKNHCRYGQGFLFSKPLPAKEMECLLVKGYILVNTNTP